MARLLIKHGALVNQRCGVTRATALHAAARRGHLEMALALVQAGASLNLLDSKGATPIVRAKNCRRSAVAHALEALSDR